MIHFLNWLWTIFRLVILVWSIYACCFWNQADPIPKISFILFSFINALLFLKLRPLKTKQFTIQLGLWIVLMTFWNLQKPSHEKDWVDYQAKLPFAIINGSNIEIHNFRNDLRHLGKSLNWESREFNLEDLSEVRFGLVTFTEWRGLAHVFLSFNFNRESYLCLSGEIRRENGEEYSPLKGCFKNYEMMIVIGSEPDIIGLRIYEHQDPVTFYPLEMSKENAQKLLLSLLETTNSIHKQAIFYNTITNNCAILLRDHFEKVYGKLYRWDLRLLFPGYTDLIGIQEDIIQVVKDIESTRKIHTINDKALKGLDEPTWSQKIRE